MQASVYKSDFDAERKSREELNDRRLELEDKVMILEAQLNIDHERYTPERRTPPAQNGARFCTTAEERPPQNQRLLPIRLGSAIEETGYDEDQRLNQEAALNRVERLEFDPQATMVNVDPGQHGLERLGGQGANAAPRVMMNPTPQPLLSTNTWPNLQDVSVVILSTLRSLFFRQRLSY